MVELGVESSSLLCWFGTNRKVCSGEIASPIESGCTLGRLFLVGLVKSISFCSTYVGLEICGICGLPSGLRPNGHESLILENPCSSLAASLFRLEHLAKRKTVKMRSAKAAPPIEMPMICPVLSLGRFESPACASGAAVVGCGSTVGRAKVGLGRDEGGVGMSVAVRRVDGSGVDEDKLEVAAELADGVDFGTASVAIMVACVGTTALGWPLHMR